ncbi:hypothetical protein ACFQS3_09080 [Glycomyces mayteni]|uniref:Tetratricopeptide repeat protein n=1 Tax=Glycomyces mayteni TaxID=543887 RepID=A0ABW2D8S2_9ACTN|nr:hypothetical protein GCM10025732_27740 [Glycomyces mayteni]
MKALDRADPEIVRYMLESRVLGLMSNDEQNGQTEALRFIDSALERYGPESVGPVVLAHAYGFSGRTEEAFTLIEAARAADPSDTPALLVHASLLHREERYKEQAEVLREAITHHPDKASFHAMLASVGDEGISEKAMKFHYERALELEPDGHDAHIAGVAVWKRLGDPEKTEYHRDFLRRNHPEAYKRLAADEAAEAAEAE